MSEFPPRRVPIWIQWGTYPVMAVATIAAAIYEIKTETNGRFTPVLSGVFVLLMLFFEWWYPLKRCWQMNWFSAKRDVFFLVVGAITLALSNIVLSQIALWIAPDSGLLANWPPLWSGLLGLLVYQALQYTLHRFQHESQGALGSFLWKVHRVHHVSDRVYFFIHARFHPLDGFATKVVMMLPLALLGLNAEALYLVALVIGLQGVVSHLNVDLKVGWLNYVVTSTENHRFHHSSDISEAKNYGATLPIFDILFGTFVYKPDHVPQQLGVSVGDRGPGIGAMIAHLQFPFQAQANGASCDIP